MRFERRSIATGRPRTQMTSMLSTTYTERMRCSNILNRASAFAGGATFSHLGPWTCPAFAESVFKFTRPASRTEAG